MKAEKDQECEIFDLSNRLGRLLTKNLDTNNCLILEVYYNQTLEENWFINTLLLMTNLILKL